MPTKNFKLDKQHSLLRRQLKRHFTPEQLAKLPEDVTNFINTVGEAYHQSDADRGMLERSLELSSQELLQAYSEIRGIFKTFPDLFFRIDPNGRILGSKIENTGNDLPLTHSLKDKKIQELFPPSTAEKFQEAIHKAIQRQGLAAFEYSLDIDNQRRYYEARILPLSKTPALSGQLIILIRNITSRKVAENRLEEYTLQLNRSYQDLSDFTFLASHDIQEPLKNIEQWAQECATSTSRLPDNAEQNYMAKILHTTKRMRVLIEDLLEYSRVSAHICEFEIIKPNKIVQEILEDLDAWIHNLGGSVQCSVLPTIEVDTALIRQLFQHLINNSLKFRREETPPVIKIYEDPLATLSDTTTGTTCRIVIEDNGIGLDKEHCQTLFRVFQRLHDRDKYEGSGIGLALCRKIAERHGGRISVTSELGQGSRFVITLPLRRPIKDAFPI